MKKTILLSAALILCATVWAQVPQGITHQAVIRNTQGELVTGQLTGIQISILQGSVEGTAVYVETHSPTSNAQGLITYVIGQGTPVSGSFAGIDWADGPYFLKTEVDPAGGTSYTITGTTQFLSVPYALHAGSSSDNQWEQSGNNIFTRNTGNVGIGITNANERLEIDGNARLGNQDAGFLGLGFDFLGGEIGLFDITGDKILAGKFYSGPASGTYVFGDNLFIRSGNVGIGTSSPDASAILELSSTDKGFLPPRMTKTQIDAIASPAEGLVVTCTDCDIAGLQQYINGDWIALAQNSFATGDYGAVVNPSTGKTWLDRNLGASQVAASSTDPNSYGDLYQWGRSADGHQLRTSGTTNTQATTWLAGIGAWNGLFISGHHDWLTIEKTDLWSGTAAENNPCPSGFRVPTIAEWNQERLTWSSNNAAGAFASPLKLPVGGFRYSIDGSLYNVGLGGYYWSSTVDGFSARRLHFYGSNAGTYGNYHAYGHSVRCLKD